MKKFLFYILLTSYIFGKNFTLSVGAENRGKFKSNYATDSNSRVDIEFLNHEKRFGVGVGSGINYVNIDRENYLLTTNVSLNTAVNIVNNELYNLYLGVNVGYSYPFVTVYHMSSSPQFIKTALYYEFKFGAYYNDFNVNVGLSTLFLNKTVNNVKSSDSISRISVNAGFFLF